MNKKGWLPYKEFKYIYTKVPRLCVDIIIENEKGIILSKRNITPDKGKWHFPGGTVIKNEKLISAVKRISQDETGLNVKVLRFITTIEYFRNDPYEHAVSIVYLTKPISGSLRGSNQAKEIEYFKKVPRNIIKEHASVLNNFLKGTY
jgi:ADP-ribose pyrophosphatase YjhB (NUDIX family)